MTRFSATLDTPWARGTETFGDATMSILSRSSVSRQSSRRGAIVVLVAVCLSLLLVCAAISLDGGGLLEQRRRAQATADAAAMAAAESVFRNYPTDHGQDPDDAANDRGHEVAYANGFTDDGTNTIVTVHVSPERYMGGPHQGQTLPRGYAEVFVQRNQKRYFSSIIGSGTIPITARAVARGQWVPAKVGIHVLDLHAPSALRSTGNGTATVTGGAAVIVNSDDSDAAARTTGNATLNAVGFSIVGGISGGGFIGAVETGTEPQPDPLRFIPEPNPSNYTTQSNNPTHYSNGNRTLQPGVYKGGISISGTANLTLAPGIYYMDGGGFSMAGQGTFTAPGVMIFNAPSGPNDRISITGNGAVTMTPPTSGIYQGMTLFQKRSATQQMNIAGNGSFTAKGTFYAANALMNVAGNGAAQIGSQFVSRYLDINGNGALNINYNPDQVVPRRVLGLVE
jgi:Putative Flp pilus-assembly TadE/G-like